MEWLTADEICRGVRMNYDGYEASYTTFFWDLLDVTVTPSPGSFSELTKVLLAASAAANPGNGSVVIQRFFRSQLSLAFRETGEPEFQLKLNAGLGVAMENGEMEAKDTVDAGEEAARVGMIGEVPKESLSASMRSERR